MKTLTLRLSDSELTALRSHASAKRMSMTAVIMQSLDSHVPNFKESSTVKMTAPSSNFDLSDLDFQEEE
jgi:hypothetical protein